MKKNHDYNTVRRNKTINSKRQRYHLNFNDLVIKSEFNTKFHNEKGKHSHIKTPKQNMNKINKKF